MGTAAARALIWSGESPQCDREDDDDARQQAFSWRAWLGPPKDALAFTVRTFLKLVLHRFHMQLSQYATISPPLYMREYLLFACLSFFSLRELGEEENFFPLLSHFRMIKL